MSAPSHEVFHALPAACPGWRAGACGLLAAALLLSPWAAQGADGPGPVTPLVEVRLLTDEGPIVVAVDLAHAPLSGADFLRYVDQGLYAGATFYRSVRPDNDHGSPGIEVIQGGVAGEDTPLPPVPHESTQATGMRHHDGTLSLARGAPGTGSAAAFFICIGAQPGLDFGGLRNPDQQGFAAFGQVVQGMEVVRRIHAEPTDATQGEAYVRGQMLARPVHILRAERVLPQPPTPPGLPG